VTSLLAKTTVEDIFLWIKKAFNDLKSDPEFIKKSFLPIRICPRSAIKRWTGKYGT